MSKDSFVSLEDLTEERWKEIEELTRQVIKTKVYGPNLTRASIAAFVLWLSNNSVGLSIEMEEPEKPKKRKKHYTEPNGFH